MDGFFSPIYAQLGINVFGMHIFHQDLFHGGKKYVLGLYLYIYLFYINDMMNTVPIDGGQYAFLRVKFGC